MDRGRWIMDDIVLGEGEEDKKNIDPNSQRILTEEELLKMTAGQQPAKACDTQLQYYPIHFFQHKCLLPFCLSIWYATNIESLTITKIEKKTLGKTRLIFLIWKIGWIREFNEFADAFLRSSKARALFSAITFQLSLYQSNPSPAYLPTSMSPSSVHTFL